MFAGIHIFVTSVLFSAARGKIKVCRTRASFWDSIRSG